MMSRGKCRLKTSCQVDVGIVEFIQGTLFPVLPALQELRRSSSQCHSSSLRSNHFGPQDQLQEFHIHQAANHRSCCGLSGSKLIPLAKSHAAAPNCGFDYADPRVPKYR